MSKINEIMEFDQFSGYEKEKNFIINTINYVFFNNNVPPIFQIRGLLIHGYSGTGKTCLLECIDSYFKNKGFKHTFQLEMLNFKQYGKNERVIQEIFKKAMLNQPSIIFCDELEKCLHTPRLIRSLGNELDNIFQKKILFVCTTVSVNDIPSTLRRPGRIDREICIPIPNEKTRGEIFRFFLKENKDVINLVSERTHGYVGSDIKYFCEEYKTMVKENESQDRNEIVKRLLSKTKPSVMKDIQITIPRVKWSDIGGQKYLKQHLKECIEWQYNKKELFEKFKIKPPKGILLYGPPGCSKTLAAKALATECHLNFLSVKGPELFSKWVGESEKAVRKIFQKARNASPCILFFDEIDGIAVERGENQNSVGDRVLSQILSELDGVKNLSHVTLVAATNRPDLIDKALLRPGRIDRIVYVKPPNLQSRIDILNIYIKKMKNCISVEEIENCAKRTENYSGAELCAITREAAYIALSENSKKKNVIVSGSHLEKARGKIRTRITKKMLQFYENFETSFHCK